MLGYLILRRIEGLRVIVRAAVVRLTGAATPATFKASAKVICAKRLGSGTRYVRSRDAPAGAVPWIVTE